MAQPHPIAVVVEQRGRAPQGGADHPVGAIVEVCRAAVVDEVAVVVPGVIDAAGIRHAVGVVVDVGDHLRARDRARLDGAVAKYVAAQHLEVEQYPD